MIQYPLLLDGTASSGDVDEPAKKQHEAPEYLERRRGRRRSTPGFITGMISSFRLVYTVKSYKQVAQTGCFSEQSSSPLSVK